ncbi:MAG: P1 family peptidase [Acidobacteriota bacterium]|nr:P1 family peptidase [Acidobacteriota bacterium]
MRCASTALLTIGLAISLAAQGAGRPRARDLGIAPGSFATGVLNAITDVEGVRVGQVTLIQGDDVRTGVTAILPHAGNLFQQKVPGGVFVGNAFGKLAGSTQVDELGTIEAPVILTNTMSVAAGIEGAARWTLDRPGNEQARSVNVVVGETNDAGLNDIRGMHVRPAHVIDAIARSSGGAVAEGSVGAGTGTVAFGWKGGIGTSSRLVPRGSEPGHWTVGVIVQSNYGGALRIDGRFIPGPSRGAGRGEGPPASDEARRSAGVPADKEDGSCMIVVATDAPLDARDLKRLAARAVFAMARTGSTFSNGSGDYAIAFSTHASLRVRMGEEAPQTRTVLPTDGVSRLFSAVLDATEEALYNSLLKATTMTGSGRTFEALPIERLKR